jgi:hypothetical protein
MAAETPEVEFRSITETHGVDYVAAQRAQQVSLVSGWHPIVEGMRRLTSAN